MAPSTSAPSLALASTGLEMYRGPDSALYGTDAGASVVNLDHPARQHPEARPQLLRRRRQLPHLPQRGRRLAAPTTSSTTTEPSSASTPRTPSRDRFHAATSVANIGYDFTANTQARFTIRNAVSAIGLPRAHDFYSISDNGKQGDQDIYSGLTAENRTDTTGTTSSATASPASASRRRSSPTSATPSPTTSERRTTPTTSPSTSATSSPSAEPTATAPPARRPSSPHRRLRPPTATSSTTSPTTPSPPHHRALRLPL